MRQNLSVGTEVTRRSESWNAIYVALGFAITIEGTALQMIDPLRFPWNLISYAVLAGVTFWLFIGNGWFQNKLLGWKMRYEGRPHSP